MGVESDAFLIGVTGSRERVSRMLNAAIRSVGGGDLIVEGDDVETVNRKLDCFRGGKGRNIGIFDLLDEECMKDEGVRKKKEAFNAKREACEHCPIDCPNSKRSSDIPPLECATEEEWDRQVKEYCPWGEPFYAEDARPEPDRYIEVVCVEKSEKGFSAKFSWYMVESCGPEEWADWDDVARLYDCYVFIDDIYYRNGRLMRFESATIYEPGGAMLRFDSGKTDKEFADFMDKLVERYPERYGRS